MMNNESKHFQFDNYSLTSALSAMIQENNGTPPEQSQS
jgi:hypothetical protein